MTSSRFFLLFKIYVFSFSIFSFGQGNQPVSWDFKSELISNNEVMLIMTANVGAGWHLYSQCLEAGGPIPTRFYFVNSRGYIAIGKPEENGESLKFHDNIYEMEIIWYSGIVSFLQKIKVTQQQTKVSGSVEYMTCNTHVCIPAKQNFSIEIDLRHKKP